jgi:hypothetical protein
MKGEHKPGYARPRTGEKRVTRQPLRIDKFPQVVRDEILGARAAGKTWEETAECASHVAHESLAVSVVHRWYDLRVEQVKREVMAQAERAREIAAAFAGKGFKDLPEAAVNALSSQVFTLMESKGGAALESSLINLALVISKLITAQAKQKQVELAEVKFRELKLNAEKATNDAAKKLGKGKQITLEDINRLRERTFGLPPVERGAASGPAA